MNEAVEPVDAAQLAELDARYVPLLSFADFAARADLVSGVAWARAVDEFEAAKAADLEPGVLARAMAVAIRAAAFDTGALERLYETTRGITITVATRGSYVGAKGR